MAVVHAGDGIGVGQPCRRFSASRTTARLRSTMAVANAITQAAMSEALRKRKPRRL